ncbi:maker414 [Drosophila busckii]|uniref:Maker414 n=1 Tax=Drosophila busckii TaxID=30019 RepID=A0A0M4E010_DROBS|nr:maker414 [Drosophila busckii]
MKEQLNNVNKNKQFEEKPIKYVDPAKGPFRCVPYGNSIGIQTLRLPGAEAFEVSCDSRYDAEGWAVIQLRVNGFVNFNRTWDEYKNGFGDLRSEFWLGLEKLHLMTKFQPHELFIQLEDFNKKTRWARYSNFSIGSEAESYELLSLGEYTGNSGNALDTGNEFTAKNMKFSTPDRDNDNLGANCAAHFASGWWFNKCYYW